MISTKCLFPLLVVLAVTSCQKRQGESENPDEAAASTTAEKPDMVESDSDESNRIAKPLLWQASSPEGKVVYLFGTIHQGVDAASKLPKAVWERLEAADIFAMETDISDPSLVSAVQRTDGRTLSEELGPDAWGKLEKLLGPTMAAGLDGMKASGAASLVMTQGLPMTMPMDLALHQKARSLGKSLAYLEEPRFQMELLDRYLNSEALIQALDHMDEVIATNRTLLDAYLAGDVAAMAATTLDPKQWESYGEDALEAMLFARNRNWIPEIEKLLAQGTPFVAVGGGHLVGEKSVLELLSTKGYKIERLAE